jgi:3-polyprenyl-4-hydroxybenzoate decarboxylase
LGASSVAASYSDACVSFHDDFVALTIVMRESPWSAFSISDVLALYEIGAVVSATP